jgi:hypothetical protein
MLLIKHSPSQLGIKQTAKGTKTEERSAKAHPDRFRFDRGTQKI